MAIHSRHSFAAIVTGLGIAQIISWGSFYYAIAVLGQSMQRDLGISQSMLFGSFTVSLLVSGFAAPTVGRLIDQHGGRRMLMIGSCIGCAALLMLASSRGPVTLLIASVATGLSMSMCMYEAAFITLNQVIADRYRSAVTVTTLFGGLASTAFWPLSQLLMQPIGWRWTLVTYAAMQLLICLPLHWLVLPPATHHQIPASTGKADVALFPPARGSQYNYLAVGFAIGSFVLSVLSVHIIGLFRQAGLSAGEAVLVASLIGPMQVLVRALEFLIARNVGPVAVGAASFVLMVLATLALYFVHGFSLLAFVVAILYGFSNGIMTIIRGTVPAVLFGRESYGLLLGRLARPAFVARALAPFAFSLMLTMGVLQTDGILMLSGFSALAGLAYLKATRIRREVPA